MREPHGGNASMIWRVNEMKIIARIDNRIPNSEATTAKAMRNAGYKWDEEKGCWRKGGGV